MQPPIWHQLTDLETLERIAAIVPTRGLTRDIEIFGNTGLLYRTAENWSCGRDLEGVREDTYMRCQSYCPNRPPVLVGFVVFPQETELRRRRLLQSAKGEH